MPNNHSTPTNFIATVYGNLTPLNNSAFSKARLKIFYKGLNRNGSYITDEVAEKLLATLPGTPVVGYFDADSDDFLDHVAPEQNKPYGFVPQDMNFSWEMSLDPDGVYRTYACTDVVLWTGRYPIASRIVGKSHSMELNPDTIKGEWVDEEDNFYFRFIDAEFFGLCVLGNNYEPCFEGSSFYSLHKDKDINISVEMQEMFSLYKKELDSANENQTGGQNMEDKDKDQNIDEEVKPTTPSVEEEEKEEEEEKGKEEKKDFTENKEDEKEKEEKPDEEEEEEDKDDVDEEVDSDSDEEEKDDDDNKEESDDEEEESDEESEKEPDLNSKLAEKDAEITSLKAQLEELNSYKTQKIKEEKEEVLNTYSNKLSEEEIAEFKNKLDSYTDAIELKKEIALRILDKENAEEAIEETSYTLLTSRKEKLTGAAAIVAKYVKK